MTLQDICLAGLEGLSAKTGTPLVSQTLPCSGGIAVDQVPGDTVIEARFIADIGPAFVFLFKDQGQIIVGGEGLTLMLRDYGDDPEVFCSVIVETLQRCLDGNPPSSALARARGQVIR